MRRMPARRRDASWNPPSKGGDVGAMFAVLVAVPLMLPVVVHLSFLLFVLPLVILSIGALRATAVARRRPPRAGWLLLAGASGVAAVASALGAIGAVEPSLEL